MIRPLPTTDSAKQKRLRKNLRSLIQFIDVYCRGCHADSEKTQVVLKTHDLSDLYGKPVCLCSDCQKLMTHAMIKRSHCPQNPKPQCIHCPSHCYHPKYRRRIQQVMKYSGRKLVMSGRVDMLLHLLF